MFELGQRKFLLLRPFSGLGRHVCAGLVRQGTLSAAPTAAARRVGFPASGQLATAAPRRSLRRHMYDGCEPTSYLERAVHPPSATASVSSIVLCACRCAAIDWPLMSALTDCHLDGANVQSFGVVVCSLTAHTGRRRHCGLVRRSWFSIIKLATTGSG